MPKPPIDHTPPAFETGQLVLIGSGSFPYIAVVLRGPNFHGEYDLKIESCLNSDIVVEPWEGTFLGKLMTPFDTKVMAGLMAK